MRVEECCSALVVFQKLSVPPFLCGILSISFAPSFIRTHANALFLHYSLDLRHPCITHTVAKYLS